MTYKIKKFIDAIPGSGGIIETIRRRVGCDWTTAKRYIEKHPSVRTAYDNEVERIGDLAQSVIIQAISSEDHQISIPTSKWYLSKKRKAEYGDNIDVTSNNEPIIFEIVKREEKN